MAKLYTYLIMTVGIWIMLTILGVTFSGSFVASKLGLISPDAVSNIQNTEVWTNLITKIGLISVAAVVLISILSRNVSTLPITAILATGTMVLISSDMIFLIQQVPEVWMKWVLFAVIGPWIAGFIIVLWDWIRSGGSD